MTGGALFSIVLVGSAPVSAPLALASQVQIAGSRVTLGEVADLSVLPSDLRAAAKGVVVATFGAGQTSKTLRASAVASRARAQVPALAPWFGEDAMSTITLHHSVTPRPAPPAASEVCLRVLAPLDRDAVPTADEFEPAACKATSMAFRYDVASGVARATRDLSVGEVVRAPPASILAAARPGQTFFLRAHVGPVVVERAVQVVRPSAKGRPLFVRASGGKVFVAPALEPIS